MMNPKRIMGKAATIAAAGSILFLIHVSIAYGQTFARKLDEIAATDVSYTSENLRDPFQAYVKKAPSQVSNEPFIDEEAPPLPTLTISGITWGSSYAQAIVNGKVVKAGDTIENVQVVSISKDGLVLLYNNQKSTLPPHGAGSVKK